MVLVILHRVNTIEGLVSSDSEFGIECDIRDGLVVTHDTGTSGESFQQFSKFLAGKPLVILNIKSEGIETDVARHLPAGVDYFFLDSSFPMILKTSPKAAIRFSEYERMDTVRAMKGLSEWVWVDTFKGFHFKKSEALEMKSLGFKICIVSPELQKKDIRVVHDYVRYLSGFPIDAVCTKFPQVWKDFR